MRVPEVDIGRVGRDNGGDLNFTGNLMMVMDCRFRCMEQERDTGQTVRRVVLNNYLHFLGVK
jgi:hypothetical protein